MRKPKIVATIGPRPTKTTTFKPIPLNWPIHNAPRPLYGALTWQDPRPQFRSYGWFFAAIDPDDEYSQGTRGFIAENAMLDARELHFVTEADCLSRGMEYYAERNKTLPERYQLNIAEAMDDMILRGAMIDRGLEEIQKELDQQQ